jgi:hypothetical protein
MAGGSTGGEGGTGQGRRVRKARVEQARHDKVDGVKREKDDEARVALFHNA